MLIKVKFGDDETLLCNSSCVAVNLLSNIKHRTGYKDNAIVLDLSDEKGLVQELENRKYDQASNILTSQNRTYVLVKRQPSSSSSSSSPEGQRDSSMASEEGDGMKPVQYEYVPLLNNCLELFPDYRLQLQSNEAGPQKRTRRQTVVKAASPAGVKATKVEKRTPSKRRV